MLAVQRPRMGTSQPSDGTRPFGYTFDPDESLFLEPPEPAPGEPLLTLEDDRTLSNFFDQITSNQFSDMSFGEGLNFSDAWHGLPPQFMGTATSYGQQPAQPLASSVFQFGGPNFQDTFQFAPNAMPPPLTTQPQRQIPQASLQAPMDQSTPADAAAVLTALHNSHPGPSNSIRQIPMMTPQSIGNHPNQLGAQPRNHYKQEQVIPLRSTTLPGPIAAVPTESRDDTLFTDMAFGNPRAQSTQRGGQVPEDVHWGSDTNFAANQFVVNSEKETTEALEKERLAYMDCLKLSNSTGTTRQPSPVANGDSSSMSGRNGLFNDQAKYQNDTDVPSRKRRKSKAAEENAEAIEDSGSPSLKGVARKRKSKGDAGGVEEMTASNDTPKRRKSTVNGAKPPRENLSEEQKRSNHIKSEQRRRTLIKVGFDDLQDIVPNLKNGGYSKSAMLQIAAEFLDELVKGNAQLAS